MPTQEQIEAATDAYVSSFNKQDRDLFLSALADDVTQIDPVGSPPNEGKDALAAFWDGLYRDCERIEFDVPDRFVAGDEAALQFTIVQSRRDGTRLTIDGIDVFRVDDDGKIALIKGYGRVRQ